MFKLKKIMSTVCVATLLMSLIACGGNSGSSNSADKLKGTSDGGGGLVQASSKEEVRAAIYKTRTVISEKIKVMGMTSEAIQFLGKDRYINEGFKELVGKIYSASSHKYGAEFKKMNYEYELLIKESELIFEKHLLAVEQGKGEEADKLFDDYTVLFDEIFLLVKKRSELLSVMTQRLGGFLAQVKLNLKETGPCEALDKPTADASVSSNTFDAEICFSLERLTRLPKESMEEHIAGLWFHELAHMAGANESMSVQLEKVAIGTYKKVKSDVQLHEEFISELRYNSSATLNIVSLLAYSIKEVRYSIKINEPAAKFEQAKKRAYMSIPRAESYLKELIHLYKKVVLGNIKMEDLKFSGSANSLLDIMLKQQV